MPDTTPTLASAPLAATTVLTIDGQYFAVDASCPYDRIHGAWIWVLGQWLELDCQLPEFIESRILESISD